MNSHAFIKIMNKDEKKKELMEVTVRSHNRHIEIRDIDMVMEVPTDDLVRQILNFISLGDKTVTELHIHLTVKNFEQAKKVADILLDFCKTVRADKNERRGFLGVYSSILQKALLLGTRVEDFEICINAGNNDRATWIKAGVGGTDVGFDMIFER